MSSEFLEDIHSDSIGGKHILIRSNHPQSVDCAVQNEMPFQYAICDVILAQQWRGHLGHFHIIVLSPTPFKYPQTHPRKPHQNAVHPSIPVHRAWLHEIRASRLQRPFETLHPRRIRRRFERPRHCRNWRNVRARSRHRRSVRFTRRHRASSGTLARTRATHRTNDH